MNINKKTKVIEVMQVKSWDLIKVKFLNNTQVSWKLYFKDTEYEIDTKLLDLVKNLIY